MKKALKIAVATALLAAGSMPAFAIDGPTTGNSAVFITVFDTVLGASVVQDLGVKYNDFAPGAIPAAGTNLNFTVDLSVFSQVGSSASNIRYTVFAADGTGLFGATGVRLTAPVNAGTIAGTNGNVTGIYGPSGATQVTASINSSPYCGSAVIACAGTDFGGTYYGGGSWGSRYGSFLSVDGSETIGNALGFYQLTRTSNVSVDSMNSLQFANANGVATWLLNANGQLTYSVPGITAPPVPLPAAAWLLLSALGGLGVIGRRKVAA